MRTQAATASLFLALSLSPVLGGCDDPDEFDLELELQQEDDDADAGFRVASDPALASTYTACVDAANFNGVSTVIRYPMGHNCLSSVADSPIVLLLRGTGHDYDEYPYLLDHLAENGFIAVSANILATDTPIGHAAAAASAQGVLDDMLSSWAMGGYIDPTRLALVGHSRGGQTMRYLADDLSGGADDWDVRAVVALASKAGIDHPIVGDETNAFLVLQGTVDPDQKPNRGYENYDRAGGEGSVSFGSPELLHKSMKLLENGNHSSFSQAAGLFSQAHVTKGYVLAFLAQHLQGDSTWYEDYIRGDEVPWGWGFEVVSQVSDGSLRKVVDNFEDGSLANSTIGGGVTRTFGVAGTVLDLGAESDYQHQTHALRTSSVFSNGRLEWSIPPGQGNAAAYKQLSLRIGQVSGVASDALFIQLRNDGVWSPMVRVGDHGTIPMTMDMCENNIWTLMCNLTPYHHMGTVRIPTSAFGDHDDVEAVRLVFSVKALDRQYVIDSLEFSESVFSS